MKKEFFGFYKPKQEEIEKFWKDGFYIFDSCSLLNLYRYSEPTRKDFLIALGKLKDKLFMPYQVGYEYHSNRYGVIETLKNSHSKLLKEIKDVFDMKLLEQYVKHPSIEIDKIRKLQEDFLKKIDIEVEKQKKNHPDFTTSDEIMDKLTELYEGKVGVPFKRDDLTKIFLEGKERYDQQIPPGYKDREAKKSQGDLHVYGDLIIWKETIAFAKQKKKPIVFVTDDRKEDWWRIENGKTLMPREELIKEFYDLTGIRILIYNADTFLHLAKKGKIVPNIKETSISEVKELRKSDENNIKLFDFLKSDLFKVGTHSPVSFLAGNNSSLYKNILSGLEFYNNSNKVLGSWVEGIANYESQYKNSVENILTGLYNFKSPLSSFYTPIDNTLRTMNSDLTSSSLTSPLIETSSSRELSKNEKSDLSNDEENKDNFIDKNNVEKVSLKSDNKAND